MKSTVSIFLIGALVGAAVALGARAAIVRLDSGDHAAHGSQGDGMSSMEGPMEHADAPPAGTAKGFLIDLGNENCPIMGNPVNGKTYTEWNGLRIGHCCPPCSKKLLADPEKALDEAGIEWRPAAKLVEAVKAATGTEREALLAEVRESYTIVRMPEGAER